MIHELQLNFHNRVVHGRSIDTTINSDRFEELYKKSSVEERRDLADILLQMDKNKLKDWMLNHSSVTVDDLGKAQLLERATALRIPSASRLIKSELIMKIKEAEHDKS